MSMFWRKAKGSTAGTVAAPLLPLPGDTGILWGSQRDPAFGRKPTECFRSFSSASSSVESQAALLWVCALGWDNRARRAADQSRRPAEPVGEGAEATSQPSGRN